MTDACEILVHENERRNISFFGKILDKFGLSKAEAEQESPAPVGGELLFKRLQVADIARGNEISTGIGGGRHGGG